MLRFTIFTALCRVFATSLPEAFIENANVLGSSESTIVVTSDSRPNVTLAVSEIVLEHVSLSETASSLKWFASVPKTFTVIVSDSVKDPEEVFNAAPKMMRETFVWFLPSKTQIEGLTELRLDSKILLYSPTTDQQVFKMQSIYRVKNLKPTKIVETGTWKPGTGFDFEINSASWWRQRADLRGITLTYSGLHWPPMVSVKR